MTDAESKMVEWAREALNRLPEPDDRTEYAHGKAEVLCAFLRRFEPLSEQEGK